jgi:ABC-type transport system involved in multi-copper enzyme maturation permease subunit
MADTAPLRTEDVLPVRSRISWGAVFAGLFTALAVSVLLSVLGTALGLTWSEHTSRGDYVSSGAAIWAAITGLVALFAGGLVTSMFTAGENKAEAVLYGIVLWGLMFAAVAGITFAGTRLAVGTFLGTANVAANVNNADWERIARDAGVAQEQINQMRPRMPAVGDVRATIDENVNRQNAARAAWWSLLGTVLSMLAAVGGTLAGSGPEPILRGLFVRRAVVTAPAPAPGAPLPPR